VGVDVSKACGYNQVSVRVMKGCKHELIPYLVYSINCSMSSGIYPECLKLAKVRPLHKSGNKRHVATTGQYRFSRLSTKSARKSFTTVTFINKNGLLSNFQFSGRSLVRLQQRPKSSMKYLVLSMRRKL
jgi:hypothetical protein